MSLFQSNLRKQIRKLPKILKSVKIIHHYSLLFIRVLTQDATVDDMVKLLATGDDDVSEEELRSGLSQLSVRRSKNSSVVRETHFLNSNFSQLFGFNEIAFSLLILA